MGKGEKLVENRNEESKEGDRDSEKKLVNQDNLVVVEH